MATGGTPTARRRVVCWWTRSNLRLPAFVSSWASRLFGGVDKDSWQLYCGADRSREVSSSVADSKCQGRQRHLSNSVFSTFQVGGWKSLPGNYPGLLSSHSARHPFLDGSVRFKSRNKIKKAKQKKREILSKIKRLRIVAKKRLEDMTPEELIEFKIARAKRKIDLIDLHLKTFPVQEIPPPDPDLEVLTPEHLHYLRRVGHKNRNYLPVGRRGIFGGTIQNIHLHWKKHETVQVEIAGFSNEEVKVMADQLARLSGGICLEIYKGNIVILYRGRNYEQPKILIPQKTLDKRKALMKSKLEQSKKSALQYISRLENDLVALQENREAVGAQFEAICNKSASLDWDSEDEDYDEPVSMLYDEESLSMSSGDSSGSFDLSDFDIDKWSTTDSESEEEDEDSRLKAGMDVKDGRVSEYIVE